MESKHCQNVNYQVSTGLCWRQGTEVGENRGNRVDNQLQTNNITKHSVKMVLLSEQMMTNAQCTYTDLKPIMIKLSILLFWIAFLILLFWRRKTFESDHTIIARKRDTLHRHQFTERARRQKMVILVKTQLIVDPSHRHEICQKFYMPDFQAKDFI